MTSTNISVTPRPPTGLRIIAGGRLATVNGLAADACRHYFVKENGRWTCTMCGATR
jgi:hypothetical protein